jgi:hypothetical protein
VLGAFLFSAPTNHAALAPFAPSLVGAVVLAGIVYPLVFGGLGGWLEVRYRSRADRSEGDDLSATSR